MSVPFVDIELGAPQSAPSEIHQQSVPRGSVSEIAHHVQDGSANGQARSWWLPKSWSRRVSVEDEFETYIKKSAQGPQAAMLARDYTKIKRFSLERSACHNLFSCDFYPRTIREAPSNPWGVALGDEQMLFWTYINNIRARLEVEDTPQVLRTCVICCQAPPSLMPALYQFKSNIFTSTTRFRERIEAPWRCLVYMIAERWKMPVSILESCVRIGEPLDAKLAPFSRLYPTTPVKPDIVGDGWVSTELHWFAHAPQYRRDYKAHPWLRDYKIYVWQPQVDPNSFPPQMAKVVVSTLSSDTVNMAILLRPSLEDAKSLPQSYQRQRQQHTEKQTNGQQSTKIEVVYSILSIYDIMLSDTRSYLTELWDQIAIMRVEGRQHPTVGKINFIHHLDDTRHSSMIGLQEAESTLPKISALADDDVEGRPAAIQAWSDDIKDRTKALLSDCEEIGSQLADLRSMIKEQIDLQQNGLTGILTVLAAIYVPFSFVSSVFGMNLSDPLWSQPPTNMSTSTSASSISSALTASVANLRQRMVTVRQDSAIGSLLSAAANASISSATSLTANSSFSQSQTDQILSAITSSGGGGHLWTFTSFWYTACIATAITVLLPLLAGGTFRIVLRFSYNHRHYWHVAVFIFVLGSMIVLDIFLAPLYFLLVFAVPQGIFLGVRLWQIRKATKHRKRWVVYATLFGGCLAIDLTPFDALDLTKFIHLGQNIGLTAFLPTIYLFLMWIQPSCLFMSRDRLIRWTERTASWPTSGYNWNRFYAKRPRLARTMVFTFLEGLNILLANFLPGSVYLIVTTVPLGLYGMGRMTTPVSSALRLHILSTYVFLIILSACCILYTMTAAFYFGTILLFPCLYLYFEKDYVVPFLERVGARTRRRRE